MTPLLRGKSESEGHNKITIQKIQTTSPDSGMLGVLLDGSLSSKDGACRVRKMICVGYKRIVISTPYLISSQISAASTGQGR